MTERWLWVLEKQDIKYNGETVPFGTNWDEWIESATSYPFMPPVLGRSETGQHDENTNPVIGHVTEWRVMTQDEALAKGINVRGGTALYCKVKPAEADSEERIANIAYVSPSLVPQFIDETGNEWPLVITHVAEVSVPFQQLTQPDQRNLLGVQMSATTHKGAIHMADEKIEEVAIEATEAVEEVELAVEEAVAEVEDFAILIEALHAEIAALRKELEELKGKPEEDVEEVDVETVAEAVSLQRAVQKALTAERRADDILRTRQWSGNREQLVHLCRDNNQFITLQKSLAVKPNAAPRVGEQKAKGDSGVNLSALSAGEKAKHLSRKEGISFTDALKRITKGQ